MTKGLYILEPSHLNQIYGPCEQGDISRLVDICDEPQTCETIKKNMSILSEAEVIFSGWGAPSMDEKFLDAAPKLKVFFYGSGSVRGIVTEASWDRDLLITCAASVNAIPVAEYVLSQILFSLKCGWYHAMAIRDKGRKGWKRESVPGVYGSKVGIISLGKIGRLVCKLLQPFDVDILAFDPFVTPEEASELGVIACSLEHLFEKADVVSIHAPNLPETYGMINGKHIASMKENAVFINTARGTVVREAEMTEILSQRPDIWAILDVTYPEPPVEGSLLLRLPNVIMTPHIAGSLNNECRRMGRFMVEELQRYLRNEPLLGRVTRETFELMA
jgi:phosphoglycerate dehydrogenase-like enzyme